MKTESIAPNQILRFSKMLTSLTVAVGIPALAAPQVKVGVKAGILDGILNANIFVQLLLLLLVAMSVVSWTIIFFKYRQLNWMASGNRSFLEKFWQAPSLEALNEKLGDFPTSSIARVFRVGFLELQRIADAGPKPQGSFIQLRGIDNLERALQKGIESEIAISESRLSFLATTGSTAPFIGLLGTVLGIMTSFSQIASTGSASLAVVAPGISEALFATAVGLVAALPAVAAYNYFIGLVRKVETEMNGFASDFLNIAKRNFFRED